MYHIQGNYNHYNGSGPGDWGAHSARLSSKPTHHSTGIYKLFEASCPEAFHDSQARNPPPKCLPGTRVDVLKEIFDWIARSDDRILWISGPAGAGKSAIAQTVAEACANNLTLAASFFFLRGALGRNTGDRLIPSITYQIVMRMPQKRAQIGNIVVEDISVLTKPQHVQIQKLIIPLFVPTHLVVDATGPPPRLHRTRIHRNEIQTINSASSSHPHTPFLLIIDGLDECQGDDTQYDVVKFMGELVNTTSVPLSCIIISRPEPQIEESFGHLGRAPHCISLGSPHHTGKAKDDIHKFLRHGFDHIYQHHNFATEEYWPTDAVISELVRKSGGAFTYASTVLKYVGDHDFHPVERLDEILDNSSGPTPFAELDCLYRHILGTHKNTTLLLRVLTVVCCCLGTPPSWLSSNRIEKLLQLRQGTVMIVLRRMCSIIDIQDMSFYHKSFTDFIHNKERAQGYYIDIKIGHASIAQMLLRSVSTPHTEDDLLFQYAAHQWSFHCEQSGRWDENVQLLEEISMVLDCYERLRSNIFTSCVSHATRNILQWFEVDKIQPPDNGYHPLDVQYRLFKQFWRDHITLHCTVHIFTFYEETDLGELMDYRLTYNNLLPAYWPQPSQDPASDKLPNGCWRSVIAIENRKSFPDIGTQARFHGTIVYGLVKRLMNEPGILEQYDFNFVDSHIEVVTRCLDIIVTDYPLDESEPEVYSYARKYWTKHLSHVPPGDLRILDSLKELEDSELHHELTTKDVRAIQAWLKLSNITP